MCPQIPSRDHGRAVRSSSARLLRRPRRRALPHAVRARLGRARAHARRRLQPLRSAAPTRALGEHGRRAPHHPPRLRHRTSGSRGVAVQGTLRRRGLPRARRGDRPRYGGVGRVGARHPAQRRRHRDPRRVRDGAHARRIGDAVSPEGVRRRRARHASAPLSPGRAQLPRGGRGRRLRVRRAAPHRRQDRVRRHDPLYDGEDDDLQRRSSAVDRPGRPCIHARSRSPIGFDPATTRRGTPAERRGSAATLRSATEGIRTP